MTAGKTRVGEALAGRTGMPFVDVDSFITRLEQRPIHEIFRERGEPYFRKLEAQVLVQLCQGNGQIISCGGGTILLAENRELLAARCETVWLRVSEESVLDRLEQPDSPRRPLLEGLDTVEIVGRLLAQREPFYAQADHIVDTDGRHVLQVAEEIALRLGLPMVDPRPEDRQG